jgi:hypothetical protein
MIIRVTPGMALRWIWSTFWSFTFAAILSVSLIPLVLSGNGRLLPEITEVLRKDTKRKKEEFAAECRRSEMLDKIEKDLNL